MNLFHDEEDTSAREPVRGLPQNLPEGERILWQGRPRVSAFAVHTFHIRLVGLYFIFSTLIRLATMSGAGAESAAMAQAVAVSAGACIAAIAVLSLIAALMARSTCYTITNRRIVLRFGVAIRKYVNLPFGNIAGAAIKPHGQRAGDIALQIAQPHKIGYLHVWPHVRPFRYTRVEPMLRTIPEPEKVGQLLADAMKANAPDGVVIERAERPDPGQSAAADRARSTGSSVGSRDPALATER